MANKLVRSLFSHILKRFLCASASAKRARLPTATSTSSSSFTVQFLVKSCEIPLQSALSVSQTLQLDGKNLQRYESVMKFLKSHKFSGTQMAKLIAKKPAIFQSKVEDNLLPKFNYLKEQGFVGDLLPELIVSNPTILRRALNAHIKPSFDILRSILNTNEKILATIRRCPLLVTSELKDRMQPNIDLLVKEGVPAHRIEKIVTLQPRVIAHGYGRMVDTVNAVKSLGFQPAATGFVHAVAVKLSMSNFTWKKKIELWKSVGWSEEEILSAFRKEPFCMACSEEKFRNVADFYLNTIKLDPQTLISYPKLLMYAIDKRIRPRYNVLKALESKKLVKRRKKIVWQLTISEKKFQENFVSKYANQVPGLLEIYLGTRNTKNLDNKKQSLHLQCKIRE